MGGLHGAQVGWIGSVASGQVYGAQVSLVNVANGPMRGVQVGLANVERGTMNGVQVGLTNVLRPDGDTRGVQVGLANVATGGGVRGAASVGLVNVGRKQRGVQVGLINVADEIDGAQVGLVSFARKNSGASISLLPIVLDGENHLTLGWTSASAANLGFKLGTRRVYAALSVGITRDTEADGPRYYASTFGLGVHVIPRDRRFFLDLDITGTNFETFSPARQAHRNLASLRLQAGYAVARRLAVVVGPTLHVQTAWDNDDRRPRGVSFAEQVWTSGGTTVRLYPGLVAGLEF
jgi:hypothetical protein